MLGVRRSCGRTAIGALRQAGSSKLLFPRQDGPEKDAVLINTAGGVTSGDMFEFDGRAEAQTHLTLTTQAAERAYKANGPEPARIRSRLHVAAGATVHWLPQETILFNGCCVDRQLLVQVKPGATLLLAETLVFGRHAMGETLASATFRDRIEIRQGRTPVFVDAFSLAGDVAAQVNRRFGLAGSGATTVLALFGPKAEAALSALRDALPETAGASLVRDDLLVARILAPDSFVLRKTLVPILNTLTDNRLPRPWMI